MKRVASCGKGLVLVALCVLLGSGSRALLAGPGGGERLAELEEALGDEEGGTRRRAVRDLAGLGGRKAWELVIGALADEKGEVADEAQFQLAGLDEDRLLRDLMGKAGLGAKDGLIRSRVAEMLGRYAGELDGIGLLKRISRRDAEMSETLLWSVERLALAGRLGGDLEKCAKALGKIAKQGGEVRVRAQALCALAALDLGQVEELLPKLLTAKEHELRVASLECVEQIGGVMAMEIGSRLRDDEEGSVRLAALDVIASGGTKKSLLLLLERLEMEERLRLRVACVEHLQEMTGRKSKMDPRPWRLWIERLPEDWTRANRVTHQAEVGGTASIAGLPILSDRVCFLIDFSGSLWYEREGRPARKGKVDELMNAALPRLDEETEFNIIPYTGIPHPWREGLVAASERNIRIALADFVANRNRGSGNVFDAVLLALRDRSTDRIVILTDGAPTGGARWKLDLMMPLLVQAARFDRVAYDVIVVDAPPGMRKRWEGLAALTRGRAVAVEL
ncbi:MAG: HEAT repeat protein [Planctomycetota bacterium]|jgi:HEAT repeat protein